MRAWGRRSAFPGISARQSYVGRSMRIDLSLGSDGLDAYFAGRHPTPQPVPLSTPRPFLSRPAPDGIGHRPLRNRSSCPKSGDHPSMSGGQPPPRPHRDHEDADQAVNPDISAQHLFVETEPTAAVRLPLRRRCVAAIGLEDTSGNRLGLPQDDRTYGCEDHVAEHVLHGDQG
jgi:hypothetical protein